MASGARMGILVPDSLTSAIHWDSSVSDNFSKFSFASSVSFGEMGVVCSYFTHAGLPESFMQCVDETRQCLNMLKQKGCRILMMGCDLNSQLPPNIANITGGAVYNVAQVSHMQRVDEFLNICNDYGLRVVNTFGDSPQFTRKSWGRFVFHTHIYLLCMCLSTCRCHSRAHCKL